MNSERRLGINTSKVIYEIFDDEALLVNLDNGNYYSMDSTGADILRLLEQGLGLESLVDALMQRYEASRSAIEKGAGELLAQLEQEGLIVPQDESISHFVPDRTQDIVPSIQTAKIPFSAPQLQAYTDMQDLILLDTIHEVDESGWPKAAPDDRSEDG
jgi:hypothetical protein